MEKIHGLRIVEGMEEGTAKRYLEFRKEIDQELCQIMSLGAVIGALSDSDICRAYIADLGRIVQEKSEDIFGKMDEFISSARVHCNLMQAGFVG